jgi:hypothetical protein
MEEFPSRGSGARIGAKYERSVIFPCGAYYHDGVIFADSIDFDESIKG